MTLKHGEKMPKLKPVNVGITTFQQVPHSIIESAGRLHVLLWKLNYIIGREKLNIPIENLYSLKIIKTMISDLFLEWVPHSIIESAGQLHVLLWKLKSPMLCMAFEWYLIF